MKTPQSVAGALSRVLLGILAGSALALSTYADEISLFATTTTHDRATLSAIALLTFPITTENGVRIAVSIDDGQLD